MFAVAAIPVAVALSVLLGQVALLAGLIVAVPAALVLGLMGVAASRRARSRFERSVRQTGARTVRAGRFLVWTGLYVAVTGGLALAFYGVLRASS